MTLRLRERLGTNLQQFSASGTWYKPAGVHADSRTLLVCIGGGQNGGNDDGTNGGKGGDGGGCSQLWVPTSILGATETVTVASAGGASSFGAWCSAQTGASMFGNGIGGAGGTIGSFAGTVLSAGPTLAWAGGGGGGGGAHNGFAPSAAGAVPGFASAVTGITWGGNGGAGGAGGIPTPPVAGAFPGGGGGGGYAGSPGAAGAAGYVLAWTRL